MLAADPTTIDEPGLGRVEIFPVSTDEPALLALIKHIFSAYWETIVFGTLIQGAAWEVRAPGGPKKIGFLDGYVTVDFGDSTTDSAQFVFGVRFDQPSSRMGRSATRKRPSSSNGSSRAS